MDEVRKVVGLQAVVSAFKRLGARCRKIRGRDVYVCVRNGVEAWIRPDKITVRIPGEVRLEYLSTYPDLDEVEKEVARATNADSAYFDYPPDPPLSLNLEFKPEKLDDALRTFKRFSDHEAFVAVTNIRGELRLYEDDNVVNLEEWLAMPE